MIEVGRLLRWPVAIAALLLTAASADDEAPLSLPTMPLHDPFVVADRGSRTYYLYTRNQPAVTGSAAVGTMVYTSRDLRRWTRPRLVFTLPAGGWANEGAWAPEVHRWRGRWYLFTTVHNAAAALPPGAGGRAAYRRGTIAAVASDPLGPFRLVRGGEPVPPADRMTLDGTLVTEGGRPWMVYAREWIQVADGAAEAVPLDADLAPAGPPVTLFRASEAGWVKPQGQPDGGPPARVVDGPELHRTRTGRLMMLWSSWGPTGYTQGLARSLSGRLAGPWQQLGPLVGGGSGHGMLFRRFDGGLALILHRPFGAKARGKLYDVRETGDTLAVERQRTDLDGGG